MSEGRTCATCQTPVTGTVLLCPDCGKRLAGWLRQIPDLDRELTVTLTRQDCVTLHEGGRSLMSAPALPYHVGASDAQRALRGTIASWADWATEQLRTPPRDTLTGRCWLLAAYTRTIRRHDAAPDLYHEIRDIVETALLVVDIPEPHPSVGQCPNVYLDERCEGSVAMRGTMLQCDGCGAQWETDRWEQLAGDIGANQTGQPITITTAALILGGISTKWARKRIAAAGITGHLADDNNTLLYPADQIRQLAETA